ERLEHRARHPEALAPERQVDRLALGERAPARSRLLEDHGVGGGVANAVALELRDARDVAAAREGDDAGYAESRDALRHRTSIRAARGGSRARPRPLRNPYGVHDV